MSVSKPHSKKFIPARVRWILKWRLENSSSSQRVRRKEDICIFNGDAIKCAMFTQESVQFGWTCCCAAQCFCMGRCFIMQFCRPGCRAHGARKQKCTDFYSFLFFLSSLASQYKAKSKRDCLCAFFFSSPTSSVILFFFFSISTAHSLSPEVENLK